MVAVPSNYDKYVRQASIGTGIPYAVVAEQAQAESGFTATAVSNAGAEGWLQFLPSTYNAYAAQAGVKPGTEFDPASETKVYIVYMKALLKQFGGNLRDALAAYNAGPGNVSAGYSYADSILAAAKTGNVTVGGSTGTTPAQTTGLIPSISVSDLVKSAIDQLLKMLGITRGLSDMFQRLGLIILGFALVLLGIHLLAGGSVGSKTTVNVPEERTTERTAKANTSSTSGSEVKTASKATKGVGASEALEAAAVALWRTTLTRSARVYSGAGSMKESISPVSGHCTP